MSTQKKTSLEFRRITKAYPGTLALNDVSLKINAGEVFGLIGKNGAGKSTLLKILSGSIEDYEGEIVLGGSVVKGNPLQMIEHGISTVYQRLDLALDLSIEENIFLGMEATIAGPLRVVNHRKQRPIIEELLEEFQLPLNPTTLTRNLSVDMRQLVAIIRAVSQDAKVITLDEPTSYLSKEQTEKLFEVVALLKQRNVTTIFVSHHLNEILEITDRIGALRDGQLVGLMDTETATIGALTDLMLGTKFRSKEHDRTIESVDYQRANKALEVSNLTRKGYFDEVSFSLYNGEILGIAGLIGSGKTHLLRSLFGADPYEKGQIHFKQEEVVFANPSEALLSGIAYLPEDRHGEGIFPDLGVGENITVGNMEQLSRSGIIDKKRRVNIGHQYIDEFQIKTTGYTQPIMSLSGGNQQKAVFARLMFTDCSLLILNNPTQGVDVMSKSEIHTFISEFAHRNKAVIVVSNELAELVGLCHRVLVLKEGRLVRTVTSSDLTETKLMEYML
jgi:ABC-type sugar transport system ATPase subunit